MEKAYPLSNFGRNSFLSFGEGAYYISKDPYRKQIREN